MARIAALEPEAPVILTLKLDPGGGQYAFDPLRQYLAQLESHPRFRFVVFLDQHRRAVAYTPREALDRQLDTRASASPFFEAVNAGRVPRDRSIQTEFLTPDTTTEEALARMTALRLDAMLVRDSQRRLTGIAEREDVLAHLLLAAAQA